MITTIYIASLVTGAMRLISSEQKPNQTGVILNTICVWLLVFGLGGLILTAVEMLTHHQ